VSKAGLKLPCDHDEAEKQTRDEATENLKPLPGSSWRLFRIRPTASSSQVSLRRVPRPSLIVSTAGFASMEKRMKGNKADPMSMIYSRQR
jgi:hypothetical protein